MFFVRARFRSALDYNTKYPNQSQHLFLKNFSTFFDPFQRFSKNIRIFHRFPQPSHPSRKNVEIFHSKRHEYSCSPLSNTFAKIFLFSDDFFKHENKISIKHYGSFHFHLFIVICPDSNYFRFHIADQKRAPGKCSSRCSMKFFLYITYHYSTTGPAATRALPASFPVYFTKFFTKRDARSFAFSSHSAASA